MQKERTDLIANMKKSNDDLKAALAAAKPDEAKVKELVSAITAGQDNLFASFRKQRDEEMGLMTPVEQGKYLMAMSQWRQKMMEKAREEIIQTHRYLSGRPFRLFGPAVGVEFPNPGPLAMPANISWGESNQTDARKAPAVLSSPRGREDVGAVLAKCRPETS